MTCTTYNDETLFRSWIANNKARLSALHGAELRRYGLLVVTTTYRAPRASINAWEDKDKEALLSGKVKASMLGEDGVTLDWSDRLTDKDWSHYAENQTTKDGVVVFFDGFEVPAWDWWWEGMKLGIGRGVSTVEEDVERSKQGQQLLMRGNSLRHGMSTRESLVGMKKRSWDEKPLQMNAFSLRSPSQSTRASLLSAQSPPHSRIPSPLSMQSPPGSRGASPARHDSHQHTNSTPQVPTHSEQLYYRKCSSTIHGRFVLMTSRETTT